MGVSGTWGQSLSGGDNYDTTETGNELSGFFSRTITGSGTDVLSETGSIAGMPYNNTPATAYTLSETGNYLSGSLSMAETGEDRHSIIEIFDNTSNASTHNGPGIVDYSPVGAPYHVGGLTVPYSGPGISGELNAAATDAAFNDLGLGLLHEYCWRKTTCVFVADDRRDPRRPVLKLMPEVVPGDLVLCPSDKDPHGAAAWKTVLRVFKNRPAELLCLKTDRGNELYPTANHSIYVVERGWTPASLLKRGDPLLSRDGKPVRVASVMATGIVEDVYNLYVEGHHTYFVSDGTEGLSLLAHNVSEEEGSGAKAPVVYGPPAPKYGGAGAAAASKEAPQEKSFEQRRGEFFDKYYALQALMESESKGGNITGFRDAMRQMEELVGPDMSNLRAVLTPEERDKLDSFLADTKRQFDAAKQQEADERSRRENEKTIGADEDYKSDFQKSVEAKGAMHWAIWNGEGTWSQNFAMSWWIPGGAMEDILHLAPVGHPGYGRAPRAGAPPPTTQGHPTFRPPEAGQFRDRNRKLRNANGTFAPDGGAARQPSSSEHGNSHATQKQAQGYTLRDRDTGEVLKYGETTNGKTRYSKKYLREHNAEIQFEAQGSKAEMHEWQHKRIIEYKAQHGGQRPRLNKNDY